MSRLGPEELERLRGRAEGLGLLRLGAVPLDHPGFVPAQARLRAHLEAGKHGEMDFMARSADVRTDPTLMLPGARSVLVAVVPYGGVQGPIARYAQWADYHTELHRRLEALTAVLREQHPEASFLVCVDTKPLLERPAAALAGLGFLGKNGCLIVKGLGSYVLIGCVLTTLDVPRPTGTPDGLAPGTATFDACGSCQACLDACPTDAFDGPGELDPTRCISYLTIEHRGEIDAALADGMGVRVAGCDVCQEVCPHNLSELRLTRVRDAAPLPAVEDDRDRTPDLVRLATIGNNQHRGFVRGTALNRIPRRALRRNALLALGNVEGPLGEPERRALDEIEGCDDEQLSRYARRARRRRSPT